MSNQKIVPGVVVTGVHFCLRLWLSGLRKRPGRSELDIENMTYVAWLEWISMPPDTLRY